MKKYVQSIGIIGLTLFCSAPAMASLHIDEKYREPQDDSIVNVIKKYSNLTKEDVGRFKLVMLGSAQGTVAAGLGVAATAAGAAGGNKAYEWGGKAYQWGSDTGKLIQSYLPSMPEGFNTNPLKGYVPESLLNLVSNKWSWVIAGALGVGVGSYKFLYPRLERSILNRIKTFIDMCENIDVYNVNYARWPLGLASMGTGKEVVIVARDGQQETKEYKPEWSIVNAAWRTSNIARVQGLKNLFDQADAAVNLLAQLPQTKEVGELRSRLGTILQHLANNQTTINWYAQQELNTRAQLYDTKKQNEKDAAQLNLTNQQAAAAKQQASALWYAKVAGAWNAGVYFVKKSLETLAYIYDNKEKIAGGALIIYGSYYLMKDKAVEIGMGWGKNLKQYLQRKSQVQ